VLRYVLKYQQNISIPLPFVHSSGTGKQSAMVVPRDDRSRRTGKQSAMVVPRATRDDAFGRARLVRRVVDSRARDAPLVRATRRRD